jgi:VanZ family protein
MSPIRRWGPVVVWAGVIWIFSTHWFTSENTAGVIEPFLHWLIRSLTPATLDFIHHIIRKCAHVTEYFIFGWLALRAFRGGGSGLRVAWALAAIGTAAAYASLDEFHQSFVPGRTASVYDVMIDTAGGTLAIIVAALIALWLRQGDGRGKNQNNLGER